MGEMIQGMLTFFVTMLILNGVCILTGSNMRFGWYEKGKG